MNPICEKCFSPSTVPICGSPTTYPSSLNPVLFSPSVLGSIGASVCKYYKVNPAIGVIAGVVLGGVISIVQENRQTKLIGNRGSMYYCQKCHHVFERNIQVFTGDDVDFEFVG